MRGGSAPLAEAWLPCCATPPCSSCAQGLTRAVSDVACGAPATSLADTLTVAFRRAERAAERAALQAKLLADPYAAKAAAAKAAASEFDPLGGQGTCACAEPRPCAHDAPGNDLCLPTTWCAACCATGTCPEGVSCFGYEAGGPTWQGTCCAHGSTHCAEASLDFFAAVDSYDSYGTYTYYGDPEPPPPEEEEEEEAPEAAAPTRFVGEFGSAAHVAALSAIAQSVFTSAAATSAISAATDGVQALAALQAGDEAALDEACPGSALSSGSRFGSRLATDGADAAGNASYWLSVGRSDALIDVALANTALVHALKLGWEYPARDVLVLYSSEAAGEEWELGGMHVGSSAADVASQVALTTACDQRAKGSERCASPHGSTGGVLARRLRVLLANATTVTQPQPKPNP